MKLMIASDIHGSAYYAQKLVDAFHTEQAGRLLLLGDLLYHGPRNRLPRDYDCMRTAEILGTVWERIIAVRGNCDSEVDQAVLGFPMMADYAMLDWEGVTLYATHGHLWNEEFPPPLPNGAVLLNGHTHIAECRLMEDMHEFLYVNPGSVSLPKENSVNGYLTLESGVFTWKDMSGRTGRPYAVA